MLHFASILHTSDFYPPIYISTTSSHANSSSTIHFNSCVCRLEIHVQTTWVGIVTFFYITVIHAKAILIEEQQWYYLIHSLGGSYLSQEYWSKNEFNSVTGVQTHFEATVQHFSDYTRRTSLYLIEWKSILKIFKIKLADQDKTCASHSVL